MAEEYTREWKFRAWDPVNQKMFSPEALEEPDTDEEASKSIFGMLVNGELIIKNIANETQTELLPMQSTNWFDREQYEVYEGDILEIDDRYYQVIWDEDTSGYLLLGDDMSVSPGGAYLTDAIKIVGNIFENGDAEVSERKRLLRFRAWDPDSKKMYMPEDIKDPETDFNSSIYAYLSFGALYIYDIKNDPPMELIPMQDTGWKDINGTELFEGDIVKIGEIESIAEIIWSDEIGQFVFMANDGTLMPGNLATAAQSELTGNVYENSDMVVRI